MISTPNQREPEVAMILANSAPIDGWTPYWLISKLQIEYILHDIAAVPPSSEAPHIQRAQYQDETLPVLSLEKYYGVNPSLYDVRYTYLVTKLPLPTGGISKTVLRLSNPVRIRKLNFNAAKAQETGLQVNDEDILGAFTLPDNQLVIVPDITAILRKELFRE